MAGSGDGTESPPNGILYWTSAVTLMNITDGTSNTLMVGERPPSQDLYYGWWFAGCGYDNRGTGDVVLGPREYGYAAALGCPPDRVGLRPGRLSDNCDQVHFFSMHSGGGNFDRSTFPVGESGSSSIRVSASAARRAARASPSL